jgi:FKBP-type peptidyl-prolyl cis-trans isomerase FklB
VSLKRAIRSMTAAAFAAALLAGNAAAQPSPAVDKTAEKAPETKAEPAAQDKQASQETPTFHSWDDQLSYAAGADLAMGLKSQRVNVNLDLLVGALKDVLAGNQLAMTPAEVTATLKKFEDQQKEGYEHAKMMMSEKNKKAGQALFAENLKKEGVVTLPSGLQYKILKQGEGRKPTIGDTVVCHYRGSLVDGTEFDSSYKHNQPATLPVKGLIKGWSEALQMMPMGSKWQLFIPPQLAYGERVVAGIPPNATLVFEVELLSIQDKPQTVSAVVK